MDMKPLPKIARIIEVKSFKIILLWNTSERRLSDFAPLFEQWEAEGDSKMAALRDWETVTIMGADNPRQSLHTPAPKTKLPLPAVLAGTLLLEMVKLFSYPLLPENLARPEKDRLIRPPYNPVFK